MISPHVAALRARVGPMRLLLPSVTGIVYDGDGRILLVRQREGGVWSTPGGAIEPDETPADAVTREVQEETGLDVRPERILGVFGGPAFVVRYANGDETQYVITVFECVAVGGQLQPDGDETVAVRFVAAEELRGLHLSPWLRKVLPLLYARPERAIFRAAGRPAAVGEPRGSR
jgi:ADP-ribose pyrophosphatase YjhB (NUDIX family)